VAHLDEPGTKHRRRPYVLTGVGVAVLMLAVAGVLGGFRSQPSGPETAGPGAVVQQGLFDVQVTDARAGRMKLSTYDPVRNLLLVRMRVTDLGKQSYGISTFLSGVVAEPKPGTYLAPDLLGSEGYIEGQVTSTLHPRIPITVQLVWPLGDANPQRVTLALREWSYGQSFTSDEYYWSTGKSSPVKAKVTLPVRRGATS
jgi:hypothetical protein